MDRVDLCNAGSVDCNSRNPHGQGAGKEGLKLLFASSHFLAKNSEKMPILIKELESA